jgi:AcrR family transcriptional regulator
VIINRILEAATHIFARKGCSPATMGDITRGPGLTRGEICQHFSLKREIFMEIFREHKRHNRLICEF